MNKSLVFALAAAGTLLAAGAAHAGVQWSVGINVPGVVIEGGPLLYSEPAPVYYRAPTPVYAPVPVYAPAPAYVPAPVYYPRWHHHHRPVPVVVAPRFEPGWQPVVAPRFHDDHDRRD